MGLKKAKMPVRTVKGPRPATMPNVRIRKEVEKIKKKHGLKKKVWM